MKRPLLCLLFVFLPGSAWAEFTVMEQPAILSLYFLLHATPLLIIAVRAYRARHAWKPVFGYALLMALVVLGSFLAEGVSLLWLQSMLPTAFILLGINLLACFYRVRQPVKSGQPE